MTRHGLSCPLLPLLTRGDVARVTRWAPPHPTPSALCGCRTQTGQLHHAHRSTNTREHGPGSGPTSSTAAARAPRRFFFFSFFFFLFFFRSARVLFAFQSNHVRRPRPDHPALRCVQGVLCYCHLGPLLRTSRLTVSRAPLTSPSLACSDATLSSPHPFHPKHKYAV